MQQFSIGIFTPGFRSNCTNSWDADSIYNGIPGSEEAVIYMAKELAALGNRVIIYGDPPPNSFHTHPLANPRYVDAKSSNDERLDIAIAWSLPLSAVFELKSIASKVYLWPHGFIDRFTMDQINQFDGVLWLSEWQRDHISAQIPEMKRFTEVFGNGIVTETFPEIRPRENPYSCIYGSNYGRGLDLLLDIWPTIKDQYPQATLDIYYGWQSWGSLSPEKEKNLRAKIPELYPLDVREHGRVSHYELNYAYNRASLWVYPSYECETFCITALRAQYAGAIPVVFRWAALNETVRHGFYCSEYSEFPSLMMWALGEAKKIKLEERKSMRAFIETNFTWKIIAVRWLEYFNKS